MPLKIRETRGNKINEEREKEREGERRACVQKLV